LQLFLNCGLLFALLKTVWLFDLCFMYLVWQPAYCPWSDEAARGFWFGLARRCAHFCELTGRWRMHGVLYLFRALTDSTAPQKVYLLALKGEIEL
jgi:hypothetical protein